MMFGRIVNILLVLAVPVFLTGLISCRKNKEVDLKPDVNSANAIVLAHSNLKYVFDLLLKAGNDSALRATGHSRIDSSAVTLDSLAHGLYFDFVNTLCPDSIIRNGRVQVIYNGKIFHKGYSAAITFIGYNVDLDTYTGTDSLVNLGVNDRKAWVYSCSLPDGGIKKGVEGGTAVYSIKGFITLDSVAIANLQNPVWFVSGTINGVTSYGDSFSAVITNPLAEVFQCPWIKYGRISVSVANADIQNGSIDFIDDTGCDAATTYNFGGNVFNNTGMKHYLP